MHQGLLTNCAGEKQEVKRSATLGANLLQKYLRGYDRCSVNACACPLRGVPGQPRLTHYKYRTATDPKIPGGHLRLCALPQSAPWGWPCFPSGGFWLIPLGRNSKYHPVGGAFGSLLDGVELIPCLAGIQRRVWRFHHRPRRGRNSMPPCRSVPEYDLICSEPCPWRPPGRP